MREDMGALSGSREPSPDGLGPSGFDPARKCECDSVGQLNPGWESWYDAELELPYVNHAPGECRCTNDLAQYKAADGAVRWLCSCCCTFGDKRLAIAMEAATAGETEGLDTKCDSAGRNGIAQPQPPSRTNP